MNNWQTFLVKKIRALHNKLRTSDLWGNTDVPKKPKKIKTQEAK